MANLLRISEIERRIASKTYPNRNDLARELEVSSKTVARDIETMRDQGAPIEFDATENGYYFSSEGYRFSQLEIKAKEIFSLFLAERALDQYRGTPVHKSLSQVFDRLKSYVPGQDAIDTQWLSDKVIFHSMPNVNIDPNVWATLMAAIEGGIFLTISYESPRGKRSRRIAPLFLINYDGQWILLCYSETDAGYRNFALSRIKHIKTHNNDFFPKRYQTDIKKVTDKQFGIHFGPKAESFKIRFKAAVAMIIKERQWNQDQEIKDNKDGSITLKFTSHCVEDVKRWVMQWGDQAKILQPRHMADDIKQTLHKALSQYT